MIKKIILAGLGLAAMTMTGTASAAIQGSAHDFLAAQGSLCVACHTPHNALGNTLGPLWNAADSGGTYTMYSSASLDMTIDPLPNAQSAACLTCHDGLLGVVGVNASENLTEDLTDDHPVSIAYDTTADPDFQSTTAVLASGLKLYAGKVECASCHDVHANNTVGKLERDTGGDICLACHIK